MLPKRQTFCCDNLWKSTIMGLEKPGKLWDYFSPGHPVKTTFLLDTKLTISPQASQKLSVMYCTGFTV